MDGAINSRDCRPGVGWRHEDGCNGKSDSPAHSLRLSPSQTRPSTYPYPNPPWPHLHEEADRDLDLRELVHQRGRHLVGLGQQAQTVVVC